MTINHFLPYNSSVVVITVSLALDVVVEKCQQQQGHMLNYRLDPLY